MGGNNRQKKSSFSFFSLFKSRRPRRGDDIGEDFYMSARRVWPSEEDRGGWVAEPGFDNKAAAFIDRIDKCIVSQSDCQTFTVNPAGKS